MNKEIEALLHKVQIFINLRILAEAEKNEMINYCNGIIDGLYIQHIDYKVCSILKEKILKYIEEVYDEN